MDLVASMIQEADFTGSLTESLHQIARRIQREEFTPASKEVLDNGLATTFDRKLSLLEGGPPRRPRRRARARRSGVRGDEVDGDRRGGHPGRREGRVARPARFHERAEALIDRIAQERASVDRDQASVLAEA